MRSLWIILVAGTVLVITACFRFPKEESITTIFPKGYARPVALDKGNWKSGYNFALGEALQQADREGLVAVAPVVTVIPYAPGKAPKANAPTMAKTVKSEPTLFAKAMDKGEKKLRRLVAKVTRRSNTKRQSKDVMLSATGR